MSRFEQQIEVKVPVSVVDDQWTQHGDEVRADRADTRQSTETVSGKTPRR